VVEELLCIQLSAQDLTYYVRSIGVISKKYGIAVVNYNLRFFEINDYEFSNHYYT
jgi:hypothetical protein